MPEFRWQDQSEFREIILSFSIPPFHNAAHTIPPGAAESLFFFAWNKFLEIP